ncbi:hypothetical protein LTR24_004247 [Lithohypha guttulata]|uniref:Dopey N-terminal domain-containing protein n=1 Tax=Lithohypha guttulata TaxID=1690604 RepID=A0ABR0KCR0_9EURO|nr:hypothetical protein LTR24_004247 [Lithohypha guttulata]
MAADQKAYRRYHATIERALALFDANSDWADYIAFLTRLLRSLDSGKPEGLSDIPCKARIASCLSRCLQPSLPSGVHQKALDVYNEIFSIIGAKGLSRDLSLLLPGLSHTLAFANLSTRPMVLDLYETYLLKLPILTLRPALKALLLSLLPVIEEETSEDFDRCLHTFDALRNCFAKDGQEYFFWQTLFVASISSPLRRPGVLIYLERHLPKLAAEGQVRGDGAHAASDMVVTPEPGLLVRCFATGLRDEQALIQRGFLDMLVTHFPLGADILQSGRYQKDLDVLVSAALVVVLRRDMSLNRRLWAWFTGTDSKSSDAQITSPMEAVGKQLELEKDYFPSFGLYPIIRCIKVMIEDATALPGPRTLPFRVMLSLMDRWEIGGPVVKASFGLTMKSLMLYQSTAPSQSAFDEVFRSANVFFDGIESATLFACMTELLLSREVELLAFIVANFNVEQADTVHVHVIEFSKQVAKVILDKKEHATSLTSLLNDLTAIIISTGLSAADSTPSKLFADLLVSITKTLIAALEGPENALLLPSICISFERVVVVSQSLPPIVGIDLLQQVSQAVSAVPAAGWESFTALDVHSRIIASLLPRLDGEAGATRQQLLDCLPLLVTHLWFFLGSDTPQYHVAVVEDLWRLRDLSARHEIVESTVLDLLCQSEAHTISLTEAQTERFGTLYHHTKTVRRYPEDAIPPMLRRPALRILDQCHVEDRNEPGVRWVMSLSSISPTLKIVLGDQLDDTQDVLLTSARVEKLVKILYLSEDHWRSFSTSPDIRLVYKFCLTLIELKGYGESTLRHDSFALLKMLYGTRSGNTPPDELVSLLVDKLDQTTADAAYQEQVLDTLLAMLNDKSLLPPSLVQVLLKGLTTIPVDERLDKWITLLCNFLPNHAALLPSLLKVTNGFCKRIEQIFQDLQAVFSQKTDSTAAKSPEKSIANLLSGLEYVLARAHQQVFLDVPPSATAADEARRDPVSNRSRANDRLTVILCMQDAVRICARLWSWKSARTTSAGDTKSFQYTAIKIRTRSRKILENLIVAEPQECLETLIGLWVGEEQRSMLDLLQTLNGARPRSMMPAVFNAIYGRTNPGALSSSQKSSLSIQLGSTELVTFLNEYTSALEDDMLEEIWTDCAAFLREVLANPMPHRQILIKLIRFCSTLSRKMENTNFSEESRMQRELSDLCTRLFTAIFAIKPAGFDGLASLNGTVSKAESIQKPTPPSHGTENMLSVLVEALPHLGPLLKQYDRSHAVFTNIASNIISPAFHGRAFPQNLSLEHLELMRLIPTSSKTWRKDLLDAFNNAKFFESPLDLVGNGWLPLIKQLQANDKTILTECLNRIAPPAAAGIMLGIGATAARTEADKKTQLELLKVATIILATDTDTALPHLPLILQKIEELFSATPESSPSLATRGDVYLLLRALLLKVTHNNLPQLWPILDTELQTLCKDLLAGPDSKYTSSSKLQGAKLLDLLLLMRPDEFQLHEWLFVTDTIDAIYPPSTSTSQSTSTIEPEPYAAQIAPVLTAASGQIDTAQAASPNQMRRPWLSRAESRNSSEHDVDALLAGFFSQLSIRAFEDLYSLQPLDEEACTLDLLADVFGDGAA